MISFNGSHNVDVGYDVLQKIADKPIIMIGSPLYI